MEIGNIFFIFEKNSIHPCKRIYCDRYKVIVFIKQCATKIIRYSSGLTLGEKNKYFYTVMCVWKRFSSGLSRSTYTIQSTFLQHSLFAYDFNACKLIIMRFRVYAINVYSIFVCPHTNELTKNHLQSVQYYYVPEYNNQYYKLCIFMCVW